MSRINDLKRQLTQLDELTQAGVLNEQASAEPRARLQTELKGLGVEPTQAVLKPKASLKLILGVIAFVVVFAAGSYALLGNRAAVNGEAAEAQAGSPHTTSEGQIEAMVARLEERLKNSPNDVEGWAMLGRSYSALGKSDLALNAHRMAVKLNPKDAQAHADLADALAVVNGRSLEGEPEKIINKAIALDGNNVKALALSGTLAYNRGDMPKAAKLWERALKNSEPDSPMYEQLKRAVDDARQRAGQAPLAAAGTAAPAAAASGKSVQGRVTLAAALKAQADPEDTVFIFARPTQGSRAPLAILRTQVKNLPMDFTLDDSTAMNPAAGISTVKEVVVGARISKSGTAMPQPGDMQGLSGTVAVGAKGVKLEISETVR
jgi:cytochrome c-type biogenesis protein CcmH